MFSSLLLFSFILLYHRKRGKEMLSPRKKEKIVGFILARIISKARSIRNKSTKVFMNLRSKILA